MADETNRLKSAQLDADISVLGDDRGGEPKVARVGSAPAPQSREGLSQAELGDGEPRTNDDERTRDEIDQRRAETESARDVVDSYGKG